MLKIASLLACATSPLLAQTQTLVIPVDLHVVGNGCICDPESVFVNPIVPGKLIDIHWDLNMQFTGSVLMYNGFPETRVISGTVYGSVMWYGFPDEAHWGGWGHDFGSNPIPSDSYESLPIYDDIDIVGSYSTHVVSHFASIDYPFAVTIRQYSPDFATGTACLPNGQDCLPLWNPATSIGATIDLVGEIELEYEPNLAGFVDICDGDGIMELALSGDWQTQVRAWSNPMGNFSMLFRGTNYANNPGSSYCLGASQRINASLMNGGMDFILNQSTIFAGQSLTLQAVHRNADGTIGFSNAILAVPH